MALRCLLVYRSHQLLYQCQFHSGKSQEKRHENVVSLLADASQIRNYSAKNYWVGQAQKKCSVVISLTSF